MSNKQVYCEGSDTTQCGDMVLQDCFNSKDCDQIVLNVSYNGCFLIYPLNYGGVGIELKLSKVNKLSYEEMCNWLLEKVKDDIWRWFYNKPNCFLEDGLTLVENDRDMKKIYEMGEVNGYLDVYVCHFPQYVVTDYYLKNLFNDPNDVQVTTLLKSHEQIKIDFPGNTMREMLEWERKEQTSPNYIFSPLNNTPRVFMIDLKGNALLEEFTEEGESSNSSATNWILDNSCIVD